MNHVVVHHAIEQNVLRRHPGLFNEYELHSIENLRGIPKDLNAELHLREIRREWDAFREKFQRARITPIRQDILDEATRIDDKFGHMFIPRER